ncbi:MAG: hypothetical protein ACI8X5_003001 [Planctomycetota bacterium]|jgi:uncharacterized protein (DUF2237 family)
MIQIAERNVLFRALQPCSLDPLTGFYRDGCCRTGEDDDGSHTVCVRMTADFLAFSKAQGNDLSTPLPQYGFPGLNPGDQWCLCAARWHQAFQAGKAPKAVLEATSEHALQYCRLEDLQANAAE